MILGDRLAQMERRSLDLCVIGFLDEPDATIGFRPPGVASSPVYGIPHREVSTFINLAISSTRSQDCCKTACSALGKNRIG